MGIRLPGWTSRPLMLRGFGEAHPVSNSVHDRSAKRLRMEFTRAGNSQRDTRRCSAWTLRSLGMRMRDAELQRTANVE